MQDEEDAHSYASENPENENVDSGESQSEDESEKVDKSVSQMLNEALTAQETKSQTKEPVTPKQSGQN